MIVKFQKGSYVSSRPYQGTMGANFGNILKMYQQTQPIPDINANTQNILGVIQTNANILQSREQLGMAREKLDMLKDQAILTNKVTELQIKESENKILADNQSKIASILDYDNNLFLEGDQKKYNDFIANSEYSDEKANSLDPKNPDAIYEFDRKKRQMTQEYKNGYTNKDTYTSIIKELEERTKSLNLEGLKTSGVLNIDVANAYNDKILNIRTKLEKLRFEGINEITPQELEELRKFTPESFIDQKAKENNINLAKRSQDLERKVADVQYSIGEIDNTFKTSEINNLQKDLDDYKQITNPSEEQQAEMRLKILRFKDPEAYQKVMENTGKMTEQQKMAFQAYLDMNKTQFEYSLKNSGNTTSDLDVTMKDGSVTSAKYTDDIDTSFLKTNYKISPSSDGTVTLTREQVEQIFKSEAIDELIKKGQLKNPENSDNFVLHPRKKAVTASTTTNSTVNPSTSTGRVNPLFQANR